jgi:leader peptidase (prepilin peptidase)/N-methyltransferase
MSFIAEGMPVVFHVWVFCVGAVVGSFLNVVIARVPAGGSLVRPASRCPKCGAPIAWYDNIPLLSWIALRARCRRCGQPISARYPMVELIMAVLAVAIARQLGPTLTALGYFAFAATLVALAYIDLDTWLLPHQITWPLLAVGLASPLWNHGLSWLSSLLGAAAGFGFFAAIAFFGEKVLRKEAMGWGDVWLLSGIGAWLGWQALLPVVLLSALQGSIVGIGLIALGRDPSKRNDHDHVHDHDHDHDHEHEHQHEHEHEHQHDHEPADTEWVPPKHAVPYGPFLSLAALEHLLAGNRLAAAWDFILRRLFS